MTQLKFTKEEHLKMLKDSGFVDAVVLFSEDEQAQFIADNQKGFNDLKIFKKDSEIDNVAGVKEEVFKINKRLGER